MANLRAPQRANLLSKPIARLALISQLSLIVLGLQPATTSAQPAPAEEAAQAEETSSKGSDTERDYRLDWHWRRVHWAEIATGIAFGGIALGLNYVDTPTPRWTRVNSFDQWFRDQLKLDGRPRDRVDVASDVFEYVLAGYPILVDSLGVALIGDKNKEVFWQLTLIQAQSFAWASFLTNVTKITVRRQRPFAQDLNCPTDPACGGGANRAFFSGHTAIAFTGAGLTCVAHRHLPLYGRVGDPLACATTMTLASVTGLFRILADEHWMTDVLAGTGVGLLSGWLLPWLLHFRHDVPKPGPVKVFRYLAPYGNRTELGLQATGRF